MGAGLEQKSAGVREMSEECDEYTVQDALESVESMQSFGTVTAAAAETLRRLILAHDGTPVAVGTTGHMGGFVEYPSCCVVVEKSGTVNHVIADRPTFEQTCQFLDRMKEVL